MASHRSKIRSKNLIDRRRSLVPLLACASLAACSPKADLVAKATFYPDRAAAPVATSLDREALDPERLRGARDLSASSAATRAPAGSPDPASPFDLGHPAVDPFIHYYADRSPQIIVRSLRRAHAHLPEMRETLVEIGVPDEIVFLPIVESHFKNTARSSAGASGMWQLMPTIAKHFGLRISGCVDERRDPIRATEAAARYLSALHARFDDWHLALAAYNLGEGRIYRIMRDHEVDDFWTMAERSLLPRETAHFVPKFLAAATVATQPQQFGIDPNATVVENVDTEAIRVDDPIALAQIADLAGLPHNQVEALNPALECGRVPTGGYEVQLPIDSVARFRKAYAKLERKGDVDYGTHRVRRGESPASIARRYGVSVRALMRENGIHNPRRLRINSELRIPQPI